MLRFSLYLLGLLTLLGCAEPAPPDAQARILLMGDSLLASNRSIGSAVADVIEADTGQEVIDRSVPGARYFHALPISGSAGLRISAQYRPGAWDVVIMNGGGNDLLLGCGCGQCDRMLSRLISPDGRSGAIPALVKQISDTGAQVIYVGYLRNPGTVTPIRACGPAGNELDRRLTALDRLDDGMIFLPMADLVPHGDSSFHQIDRIHPSAKGSREISLRIMRQIALSNR
jgi:acyl-CoA thioesterase I